jgi:tetratricopeptide (TPR) repeat protein
LAAAACSAFSQPNTQRFDGKVVTSGSADRLVVEIISNSAGNISDRAYVSADGSFQLSAIPGISYELRVLSERGERIHTDYQTLRQGQSIELRLPASRTKQEALPGGPISAARLGHKPSKRAMGMFRKASELAEGGDLSASVQQLEQAVREDPNWCEAWNNLGARRLTMGLFDAAEEAFRRALHIDANLAAVRANLALTLLFLRRPAEAETEASSALKLDPASYRAEYTMGMALLQQNRDTEQALTLLRRAAARIPQARLTIAQWHYARKDLKSCANELRQFLKSGATSKREEAKKQLGAVERALLVH